MRVFELMDLLANADPLAPVYVWDGDGDGFAEVDEVSEPSADDKAARGLPAGSVVIWGG